MFDLHTHILPGIDDGPDSWEGSLSLIHLAVEDGIKGVVCTPHQHPDEPLINLASKVRPLVAELQQRVRDAGLDIQVLVGGEVRIRPDLPEWLERGDVLTYGDGGKYLLLELPFSEVPAYTGQVIFELQLQGVTPIIAHPERNEGFIRHPELLVEFIEAGALAQLTAGSISRRVAPQVREVATLYLTHNLAHILASDAHSPVKRPPVLSRYVRRISQALGEEQARRLVEGVPGAVVNGDRIEVEAPISFTRSSRKEAARLARSLAEGPTRKSVIRRWFSLEG